MVKTIYNMGPKRPQKPNQNVIDSLQRVAEQVLGKNASIRIVSGKGEHGSPRHRQGEAADLQFIDASGKIISLSDPRAKELVSAAGRNGITGFGAGDEYMGSNTFHMDMYPLSKYKKGMSQTWGSWGKANTKTFINGSKEPANKNKINSNNKKSSPEYKHDRTVLDDHEPLEQHIIDQTIAPKLNSPIENNPIPEYDNANSGYSDFIGKIALAMPKMIELENLITLFLKKK